MRADVAPAPAGAASGGQRHYAALPRPRTAVARSVRTNFCTLPDAVSGRSDAAHSTTWAGTL